MLYCTILYYLESATTTHSCQHTISFLEMLFDFSLLKQLFGYLSIRKTGLHFNLSRFILYAKAYGVKGSFISFQLVLVKSPPKFLPLCNQKFARSKNTSGF